VLTIRPADAGRFHFTVTVKSPFANTADAMNSAKSGEFVTRMLSDDSPGRKMR